MLQVGGILSRGINGADDLGHSGPELGDKMREECPEVMTAVETLDDEQEHKENLPNEMRVRTNTCSAKGASGTVTNNSDVTVDVWIQVQYLNASGTIIAVVHPRARWSRVQIS